MKRLAACLVLVAVSACESPETLGPDFGNAVRHNKAAHIINPVPVLAGPEIPGLDGTRAAGAIERYHEGQVTPIEQLTTTGAL